MKKEEIEIDPSTPLFKLTVEEYVTLQKKIIKPTKREFVFGVKGLQQLLHISEYKALSMIKSGEIDGAIHRTGKVYFFDVQRVLELTKKK